MESTEFVTGVQGLYQTFYTTNFSTLSTLLSKHIIAEKVWGISNRQMSLIIKLASFYKDTLLPTIIAQLGGAIIGLSESLQAKFEFIWNGLIVDNTLISLFNGGMINITNKDFSTSYIPPTTVATFSILDNDTFIAADAIDDFWYNSSGVLQQKTHSDLINSTTSRTFVNYSNTEPYNIIGIGILKADAILTDDDKVELNEYFKLWAEYWGVMMDSGYMKDNRIGNE
jgi:hypothetical protein